MARWRSGAAPSSWRSRTAAAPRPPARARAPRGSIARGSGHNLRGENILRMLEAKRGEYHGVQP